MCSRLSAVCMLTLRLHMQYIRVLLTLYEWAVEPMACSMPYVAWGLWYLQSFDCIGVPSGDN